MRIRIYAGNTCIRRCVYVSIATLILDTCWALRHVQVNVAAVDLRHATIEFAPPIVCQTSCRNRFAQEFETIIVPGVVSIKQGQPRTISVTKSLTSRVTTSQLVQFSCWVTSYDWVITGL